MPFIYFYLLPCTCEIITYLDVKRFDVQVENCLTTYDPHAFVLIYSITDRGSFSFAEEVLKYLWQESCTKEKAVILVGNKVDLARSRIIKCEGNPINQLSANSTIL